MKKVMSLDVRLDAHGRAVLDDELLDLIALEEVDGTTLAGGSNPNCNNNGCSNWGCSDPTQTNTNCTNTGCGAVLNTHCANRLEIGGGGGGE